VRVDDVVTWGRGVAAYRVESIDGNRAALDVSIEAGSRWFRDVTTELDGRCRALWPKLREAENLVRGWGAFQQAVADAGGWTPDMLREHSKALHPEEVRR
jgi:hypothetical protein